MVRCSLFFWWGRLVFFSQSDIPPNRKISQLLGEQLQAVWALSSDSSKLSSFILFYLSSLTSHCQSWKLDSLVWISCFLYCLNLQEGSVCLHVGQYLDKPETSYLFLWVWLPVPLWSFLRSQKWTCCQSPVMNHPILIITFTFIPHPLLRASSQCSVPPPLLLSSHPQFPCSAMTCPRPPPKIQTKRTTLWSRLAIPGLCKFCSLF